MLKYSKGESCYKDHQHLFDFQNKRLLLVKVKRNALPYFYNLVVTEWFKNDSYKFSKNNFTGIV